MLLEMILYLESRKRRVSILTNSIFFDTDCISAFLWVNNECILEKLYYGKIVIPKEVYNELSNPCVIHLKEKIDSLIKKNAAEILSIEIDTEEFELFCKMTKRPERGYKIIGKGEAASIVLAKKYEGILGSNNLKDISNYVNLFSLKHLTTGDILLEAYDKNIITEKEGNEIWRKMINKKRKLGASSFTEYIKNNAL